MICYFGKRRQYGAGRQERYQSYSDSSSVDPLSTAFDHVFVDLLSPWIPQPVRRVFFAPCVRPRGSAASSTVLVPALSNLIWGYPRWSNHLPFARIPDGLKAVLWVCWMPIIQTGNVVIGSLVATWKVFGMPPPCHGGILSKAGPASTKTQRSFQRRRWLSA